MAYVALDCPDNLIQVVDQMRDSKVTIAYVVKSWAQFFGFFGETKARKINSLGLLALLGTAKYPILEQIEPIMESCTEVLADLVHDGTE